VSYQYFLAAQLIFLSLTCSTASKLKYVKWKPLSEWRTSGLRPPSKVIQSLNKHRARSVPTAWKVDADPFRAVRPSGGLIEQSNVSLIHPTGRSWARSQRDWHSYCHPLQPEEGMAVAGRGGTGIRVGTSGLLFHRQFHGGSGDFRTHGH